MSAAAGRATRWTGRLTAVKDGVLNPEGFWAKVDRSGGPEACWPWTAGLSKGYGEVSSDPPLQAHRVAFALATGTVQPKGMHICHSCDNPPCCNPAHLWLGTPGQNARDAIRKGRRCYDAAPRGSSHGNAKLSEAEVAAILRAVASGETHKALGRRFGVSRVTVQDIARGRTWRHVPRPGRAA